MSLEAMQESMQDMEQAQCPITHHFTDGAYGREMLIPKGVCLVGARHKTNHFFIMLSGKCLISEDGVNSFEVSAPYIGQTKKGTKRAITALEDSVILTMHVTEQKEIAEIGKQILYPETIALPQWKREQLEVKS